MHSAGSAASSLINGVRSASDEKIGEVRRVTSADLPSLGSKPRHAAMIKVQNRTGSSSPGSSATQAEGARRVANH
jgi:hypothetical protein